MALESTTQIFLRVEVSGGDVVQGESIVGQYDDDRVQISSFQFSASQPQTTLPKRNDEPPRLHFDTVKVSKFFGKASLRYDKLIKARTPLDEVRITVDQHLWGEEHEKTQNSIIVFHLMHARIINISLEASEADKATSLKESIEFTFGNFAVEYYYHESDDYPQDYRDKAACFFTTYTLQPD